MPKMSLRLAYNQYFENNREILNNILENEVGWRDIKKKK